MTAPPRHDPNATLHDFAAQLRPERPGARRPHHMARGPSLPRFIVGVPRKRRALAGQSRELAGGAELTDPSLHARLHPTETRLAGLFGQARRSTTAPEDVTATAVGTSTTPYFRASSGRRETSTVTTVRPDARSSASSARQSVQSGWVNSTTISPPAV